VRGLAFALGAALSLLASPGSASAAFAVDPAVGIWVNAAELSRLPTSGDAWADLLGAAGLPCPTPDLTDMENNADGCLLGKAIASVRLAAADPLDLQAQALRGDVLTGLAQMMDEANWCDHGICTPCTPLVPDPTCTRTSLAVGRNLGAYLAAADLIDLGADDTPSRADLIAFLEGTGNPADAEEIRIGILNYPWIDGGTYALPSVRRRLRDTHDRRPNNWGGHACASTAAAAVFREEAAELLQIFDVEIGWLGNCTQGDCSNFVFDPAAADWTCDQTAPQSAINGDGWCTVDVDPGPGLDLMDLNGAQVDEMRRGGPFPAGCHASPRACIAEVHIWGGLQGRIDCAYILRRQGLDLFGASGAALRRSYEFQHRPIWEIAGVAGQPHPPHVSQDGSPNDDAFLAYIMNHVYGAGFPLDPAAGGPGYKEFGKGFGWTRYTLGERTCTPLAADADFDGICEGLPTTPRWALPLAGALLALRARTLLARRRLR
jgi:hypothetical protein